MEIYQTGKEPDSTMIKSEIQKNRTIQSIKNFEIELDRITRSAEYAETLKDIYKNTYQTLVDELKQELAEYEELKKGNFSLPQNITIIELLKNLTRIRISRGLSQQDLASMIGITRQQINRYEEHDYQNVGIEKIHTILSALNINLDMKSSSEKAA